MDQLGATGVERLLNARFGFRREAGRSGAIFVVECCAVFAEDGSDEGQLLFVAPAEGADAQMPAHAQAHVPGERLIHGVGEQSRHVLAGEERSGHPAHERRPSCG